MYLLSIVRVRVRVPLNLQPMPIGVGEWEGCYLHLRPKIES